MEFGQYEIVIFLCTNTFDKESVYASKIRDFALRLLKSKHPKQPIAGNPNYYIDSGNPEIEDRILTNYYQSILMSNIACIGNCKYLFK